MNCRFWERPSGAQWHMMLWLANNYSYPGVASMLWCHVVKPLTKICTVKLLKSGRSISDWVHPHIMLIKSSSNQKTLEQTQVWKHKKQSHNSDELLFLTHHSAQMCSLRFPLFWSPQRCSLWERAWGWWHGYWRSDQVAASTKFTLLQRGDRCFLDFNVVDVVTGTRLLKLMENV